MLITHNLNLNLYVGHQKPHRSLTLNWLTCIPRIHIHTTNLVYWNIRPKLCSTEKVWREWTKMWQILHILTKSTDFSCIRMPWSTRKIIGILSSNETGEVTLLPCLIRLWGKMHTLWKKMSIAVVIYIWLDFGNQSPLLWLIGIGN